MCGAPGGRSQRGFTLFELLAVMVIVVSGFSIAAYGVMQGLSNARERQVGRDLMLGLRQARVLAVTSGKPVIMNFDLQRLCYQAPGQVERCLPAGMQMRLSTAQGLSAMESVVAFYPDGTSSGGSVHLLKGERSWRVDIAWLTGNAVLKDAFR